MKRLLILSSILLESFAESPIFWSSWSLITQMNLPLKRQLCKLDAIETENLLIKWLNWPTVGLQLVKWPRNCHKSSKISMNAWHSFFFIPFVLNRWWKRAYSTIKSIEILWSNCKLRNISYHFATDKRTVPSPHTNSQYPCTNSSLESSLTARTQTSNLYACVCAWLLGVLPSELESHIHDFAILLTFKNLILILL